MRKIELPGIPHLKSGKVREIFDAGDKLLIVASDRISAFDFILPQEIPNKGSVLNQISAFWFDYLKDVVPNHMVSVNVDDYPEAMHPYREILQKRSMLVKKTDVIMLECIVRGYITGSGLKDYQKTGAICGIELPPGLQRSEQLPEPIFTPSTKAEEGQHDLNVTASEARDIVGAEVFETVKDLSLKLYTKARDYALTRGIIIADTKFEFGVLDGRIILIDEALTPDSSRFWPADEYQIGEEQNSFDKQYVRNYLLDSEWDMEPPVPDLPDYVVRKTTEKYIEVYEKLTGKSFSV